MNCANCSKEVEQKDKVGCVCSKYGVSIHEELIWCSVSCMEKNHPDTEFDEDEEGGA